MPYKFHIGDLVITPQDKCGVVRTVDHNNISGRTRYLVEIETGSKDVRFKQMFREEDLTEYDQNVAILGALTLATMIAMGIAFFIPLILYLILHYLKQISLT